MSRKIPLDRTIGGAYGFLFSDLVSIIGIAWFPILLFGGLAAGAIWYGALAHPLPPLKIEPGHPDIAFALALARFMIPVFVSAALLAVMLTTGLTSRALGLMEGTTYFYFNLGASFWRMFVALFVAALALVVLRIFLQVVGMMWAHSVAPALPPGIMIIMTVLGALALASLFVYVAVRLIFFLPAVVVAEERIGLGRSWYLGGGNFWRALVSLLAVLLPAFVVFAVLSGALFISTLRGFPTPPFAGHQHAAPKEMAAYINQLVPFVMNFLKANWPVLLALQVVFAIVQRALFAGASANAYRGVSQENEAQTG
jgi:hypothetical protein